MVLPLLSLLALLQSADWPRFRGPTGDGVAPAGADPAVEWSETKNVAWKTPLPGRGRSSPVVLGGRVFVTTAVEEGLQRKKVGPDDLQFADRVELGAVCLDASSGTILWRTNLRTVEQPDPVHWLNSWATPTPAVEPGRLLCDFGGFGTWCLDPETGKTLWEKRLPLDHQVGPGSSPALQGGLLFLVRDGRDAQYVAALDAKTGETVWKTERPPIQVSTPNLKKSFSTPVLIESGGRAELIAIAPHWAVAYEPATGKEIWRLRHGDGFSIGTAPVFGNGMVYLGTGFGKANLLAVRAGGTGDVTGTHLAWRVQKGVPGISSPLLVGNHLYWNSDDGVATCVDAATGELRWQERLGQQHVASPVSAGGRVYFFGREGKTTVVKPGDAFERLGENKIDGVVSATPAISGKAVFLRTDTHLYRIEAR
jgi:outer membrane protein assembly factor BamB